MQPIGLPARRSLSMGATGRIGRCTHRTALPYNRTRR